MEHHLHCIDIAVRISRQQRLLEGTRRQNEGSRDHSIQIRSKIGQKCERPEQLQLHLCAEFHNSFSPITRGTHVAEVILRSQLPLRRLSVTSECLQRLSSVVS
ncbi:hypothetical protein TNCV_5075211 [Trichonephila clavipes]|uniref:Uncharacterized protein n=1 Tax=Trichonephila clavipes TaxID=2585209 RepID=A0A8X6S5V7_TRICX|nr:hypothetical protein TNCV_5075211 [Trichonephila clavipes]